VKKPEVGYLPPALDSPPANCGPSQRGCRSSSSDSLVFSLPAQEANRSSRRGRLQEKSSPLTLLPTVGGTPAKAAHREQERKETNNWDLYLNSGLVTRKG
jgi:hypothetical protein